MDGNRFIIKKRLREYIERKRNLEQQVVDNPAMSRQERLVIDEIIIYYVNTIHKYEVLLSRVDSSFKIKTH
jgi:hypothetical protein